MNLEQINRAYRKMIAQQKPLRIERDKKIDAIQKEYEKEIKATNVSFQKMMRTFCESTFLDKNGVHVKEGSTITYRNKKYKVLTEDIRVWDGDLCLPSLSIVLADGPSKKPKNLTPEELKKALLED